MTPVIVPIYAALLALMFVGLSFRVANTRREMQIGIGSGGNRILERRVRVQGNFAEYVPIALILFTFIEMHGWSRWLVHTLCLVLLVTRIVHAYGVAQEPEDVRLRASAMVTTFALLTISALLLLIDALV